METRAFRRCRCVEYTFRLWRRRPSSRSAGRRPSRRRSSALSAARRHVVICPGLAFCGGEPLLRPGRLAVVPLGGREGGSVRAICSHRPDVLVLGRRPLIGDRRTVGRPRRRDLSHTSGVRQNARNATIGVHHPDVAVVSRVRAVEGDPRSVRRPGRVAYVASRDLSHRLSPDLLRTETFPTGERDPLRVRRPRRTTIERRVLRQPEHPLRANLRQARAIRPNRKDPKSLRGAAAIRGERDQSPLGDHAGWELCTRVRPRVSHVTPPLRSTTARSVNTKPSSPTATANRVRSGDHENSRTPNPRNLTTGRTRVPSGFITNRAALSESARRIPGARSRELANAIRSTSSPAADGATTPTTNQATTSRGSTRRV